MLPGDVRTKLDQLIQNLDMSVQYPCYQVEEFWDDLLENSYCDTDYQVFADHMKVVPIKIWMCTDTAVGYYAYFFDGVFVCISYQPFRKSDMELFWYSENIAKQVKEFMLLHTPNHDKPTILIDDSLLTNLEQCVPEDH